MAGNDLINALEASLIANRRDHVGQVPWTEWRTSLVITGGPSAVGAIPLVSSTGKLDPSLVPGGTGTDLWQDIIGGTNNSGQTMVVGSTSELTFSGTGIVNANEINAIDVAINQPTHEGQLLISQPGNTSAAWADPLVQGLYPDGSNIASPPPFATPTTIQPVYVGGKGTDGLLHGLQVSPAGALVVVDQGAVAVNHFSWDTGPTQIPVPSTLVPLISIRPKAAATTITFELTGADITALPAISNFKLFKNATLGGGTNWVDVPGSNAQEDVASTTVTGGVQVDSGYTALGTKAIIYQISFAVVGGVPDILTLAIEGNIYGKSTNAAGALRWTEQ